MACTNALSIKVKHRHELTPTRHCVLNSAEKNTVAVPSNSTEKVYNGILLTSVLQEPKSSHQRGSSQLRDLTARDFCDCQSWRANEMTLEKAEAGTQLLSLRQWESGPQKTVRRSQTATLETVTRCPYSRGRGSDTKQCFPSSESQHRLQCQSLEKSNCSKESQEVILRSVYVQHREAGGAFENEHARTPLTQMPTLTSLIREVSGVTHIHGCRSSAAHAYGTQ